MPEGRVAAALQAGGCPVIDMAARLRQLERRVHGLAAHCGTHLAAIEARWQSLPPSAQYEPFAVPAAVRAAADGAVMDDGVPANRRPRAAPKQSDRKGLDAVPVVGSMRSAATTSAVLQGVAANAGAPAHVGRMVGVALQPLGTLGALGSQVEPALERLPAAALGGVAARALGGASTSRQGRATGARTASGTPLPDARAGIAGAASAALGARSTGGVLGGLSATAMQVLQAERRAGRGGSSTVAGSLTDAVAESIGAVLKGTGLGQPLAASMVMDAQLSAMAGLAGQAARARPKATSGLTQERPSAQASAGAIGAALRDPSAAAPRAPSRLLVPKADGAKAGDQRTSPPPPQGAAFRDDASDPLAALNRLLIDQAWLRGVDLR